MSPLKVRLDRVVKLWMTEVVRRQSLNQGVPSMFGMLSIAAAVASLGAAVFGYLTARGYVRNRLKYVEAVQTLKAPLIAGLVAWAFAVPLVWLLPLVGGGTALL